jgi:hypothetical protein
MPLLMSMLLVNMSSQVFITTVNLKSKLGYT